MVSLIVSVIFNTGCCMSCSHVLQRTVQRKIIFDVLNYVIVHLGRTWILQSHRHTLMLVSLLCINKLMLQTKSFAILQLHYKSDVED